MSLLTVIVFCVLALAKASNAIVVEPHITYPTRSTVWHSGEKVAVTWDTSTVPSGGHYEGQVWLGHYGGPNGNENLDENHPLAKGFSLRTGHVEFTAPYVSTGEYFVVLYGSADNASPRFKIEGPRSKLIKRASNSSESQTSTHDSTSLTPATGTLALPSSTTANSQSTSAPASALASALASASGSASGSASKSNGALPVLYAYHTNAMVLCAAIATLGFVLVL
ncbi:hypothetical protein BJV74DRAFT_888372 [Russula compacta]|nr:hypothetical protein BJV74DRAFT_888372 [Russula compacta]